MRALHTGRTVGVLPLCVMNSRLGYRVHRDGLEVGQADLACLAQRKGLDWGEGQLLGLSLPLGQLEALE